MKSWQYCPSDDTANMLQYLVLSLALVTVSKSLSIPDEPFNYNYALPNAQYYLSQMGAPNNNTQRSFSNYILSYDPRLRLASWVFEHLTALSVASNKNLSDRNQFYFKEDKDIHSLFRARDSDYKKNNLNMTRGHLAAAGNHQLTFDHKQNTFFFSNIAPQLGRGFNAGMWQKLEEWIRRLTKSPSYSNVFVITGPLFLPRTDARGEYVTYRLLGKSQVAVPTEFFKVVLAEPKDSTAFHRWTFVMPHEVIAKGVPLDDYLENITTLERNSGLIFFPKVPVKRILTQFTTNIKLRSLYGVDVVEDYTDEIADDSIEGQAEDNLRSENYEKNM